MLRQLFLLTALTAPVLSCQQPRPVTLCTWGNGGQVMVLDDRTGSLTQADSLTWQQLQRQVGPHRVVTIASCDVVVPDSTRSL